MLRRFIPIFFVLSIAYALQNINVIEPMTNVCFNKTIVIGSPISNYEKDIFYVEGTQMVNGWKLFVDWINTEKGGLKVGNQTIMVKLIYIEDFSNTTFVTKAAKYLITELKIDFMLAPYSTKLTKASSTIAKEANILQMAPSAASTELFLDNPYMFGTLPPSAEYTHVAFKSLSELGARSIGIIVDMGHPLCNRTEAYQFSKVYNLEILSFQEISLDASYTSSLLNILQDFKDRHVETVLGCSYTQMCLEVSTCR